MHSDKILKMKNKRGKNVQNYKEDAHNLFKRFWIENFKKKTVKEWCMPYFKGR